MSKRLTGSASHEQQDTLRLPCPDGKTEDLT